MTLDNQQAVQQAEGFDRIVSLIEASQTIALCAHTDPDGDALGSVLGLSRALSKRWPEKTFTNMLADKSDIPAIYRFLDGSDSFVHAADFDETPDLFISVDLSKADRLADGEAVCRRALHRAVLDHHPGGDDIWEAGVVRASAAAAGVIVEEFIEHLGIALDKEMAQALLCAIVTDTGRFQYQNADPEAFLVTSKLVEAGASPSEVALQVYQSDRISYLHLEGKVMGRIITFFDGKVAYSYTSLADLEGSGVDVSECDGLVDVVRRTAGAEIILFLKQVAADKVRGNLRSKTDWDISKVACEMGGGGHRAAAGFTYDGDIDEALSVVLPKLQALLEQNGCETA